ncbi:hypothetical protein UF75_4636 [Desulfosporosinus sp. I2]|nr:hypothetical protein [Desulfosporosinus sp. I2]KJR44976.1 hypothetical protein UF75_4636 [Desulfosporosinus sp. I2]
MNCNGKDEPKFESKFMKNLHSIDKPLKTRAVVAFLKSQVAELENSSN